MRFNEACFLKLNSRALKKKSKRPNFFSITPALCNFSLVFILRSEFSKLNKDNHNKLLVNPAEYVLVLFFFFFFFAALQINGSRSSH